MRRLIGIVLLAVLAVGGAAAADPQVQVTDPCGDARVLVQVDENGMQPTGSLSDSADLAAVDFANASGRSVVITGTLCGAVQEPVDFGPRYEVAWQVGHCGLGVRLDDVTSVTIERAVERWNEATLTSSCAPATVELDWDEDVTLSGNTFAIRLDAADLGAYASILDPGTQWGALSAETASEVSTSDGSGGALGRVDWETGEGRDTAGPGWGFTVDTQ